MLSELRQWHKPDVISYSASIGACEKGWQWERGLIVLRDLRLDCVGLDVSVHSVGVAVCSKGNHGSYTFELFDLCSLGNVETELISFSLATSGSERSWQHSLVGVWFPMSCAPHDERM